MPTPATPKSRPPAAATGILTPATGILLVLLSILVVGQMYAALALTDQLAESLSVSITDLSSTTTAFGLAYAAGFLVAGPFSDRYGPRAVIVTGMLACAGATLAVAFAPTLGWLVALRALQGATAATFAPAAFSYIARNVEPRRRPMILTSVTSAMLAAAVVIQVTFDPLGDAIGWRGMFIASAAAMVAGSVAARLALLPGPSRSGPVLRGAFTVMPGLLRRPELALLYGATVSVMTAFVGVYTAFVVFEVDAADNDATLLAVRASSLPAFVLIASLAGVLGRMPSTSRVPLAMMVAAAAMIATPVLSESAFTIGATLFIFVAGIAITAPAIVQRVTTLVTNTPGTAVALYACAMFIGGSIGPQLVGATAGIGFAGSIIVLAAILTMGALAARISTRVGAAASAGRPPAPPPASSKYRSRAHLPSAS